MKLIAYSLSLSLSLRLMDINVVHLDALQNSIEVLAQHTVNEMHTHTQNALCLHIKQCEKGVSILSRSILRLFYVQRLACSAEEKK